MFRVELVELGLVVRFYGWPMVAIMLIASSRPMYQVVAPILLCVNSVLWCKPEIVWCAYSAEACLMSDDIYSHAHDDDG